MEEYFNWSYIVDFLKTILNQGNLILNVSILAGCVLLELLIVGWKKSSANAIVHPDRSVLTDIVFTLFAVFNLTNLLSLIFSFGVFQILSKFIQTHTNFQLGLTIENVYLQFVLLYIISDFKNYAAHWLMHHVRPLWKLHEFHHSATSFSIMTRYRLHFVEIAFGKFINAIPYAIFGAPILTFFIITLIEEFHQLFIHSKVRTDFGWLGRNVFISPDAHKVHHSESKRDYGKNYGTTLVIWDRLFGTFKPAKDQIKLGLKENPFNQKNPVYDFFMALRNAFRSLFKTDKV